MRYVLDHIEIRAVHDIHIIELRKYLSNILSGAPFITNRWLEGLSSTS